MNLKIKRPDDWHLHLRDGVFLSDVVLHSAKIFGRVVVMPNLQSPVETVEQALAYRMRIEKALEQSLENFRLNIALKKEKNTEQVYFDLKKKTDSFDPQMTLFLQKNLALSEIEKMARTKNVLGVKLYPSNATTNSAGGVKDISLFYPIFEHMEKQGVPLLIHGESGDKNIDIFEREQCFIDHFLEPLLKNFPNLKVTLEHISTEYAVQFIEELSQKHRVAATITLHHLLIDRNDLLADGIRPHYYCKPIVKSTKDKDALVRAAISGKSCFFLGTDSAPHSVESKENCCGAAGVFSAPYAMPLLVSLFEKENALENGFLEKFCSINGANHYGFSIAEETISLQSVDIDKKDVEQRQKILLEENFLPRSTQNPQKNDHFLSSSSFRLPFGSKYVEPFSLFPGRIWRVDDQ